MAKGLQPAKKQMSRRSIKLNARVVSGSWVPAEESVGERTVPEAVAKPIVCLSREVTA